MQPSGEMMYLYTVKDLLPPYVLIFSFLFLFSCEEKEVSLLPEEIMVNVLSELHIADAYTERNANPINYRNNLREDLYLEVLDKFNLDEVTFRVTYDYYTSHPYEMDTLYLKVIEKLEMQLQGEKLLQRETAPQRKAKETPPEPAPKKALWQNHDNASE